MGERASYRPGTFCWVDLGTVGPAAATAFYTGLFGWEVAEVPSGDSGPYTTFRLGDRAVCGLYGRDPEQGPPAWVSYVSVENVDAVTARARHAGAQVVQGPLDVFDAGRMAVLRDPTGAVFAVWEPGNHVGAGLVNDPGAFCLNQLNTPDPAAAAAFYVDLFGWRIEPVGTDDQPYWGIFNGPSLNGGMMPLAPNGRAPSHWLVYFTVSDLDASVRGIAELGGQVVVAPMPIPSGRISVALDSQGAVFALFEGDVDP